jgi:hypothetical protein
VWYNFKVIRQFPKLHRLLKLKTNKMNRYWSQHAHPWVSFSLLAGGLFTAMLLFFVYKIEADFRADNIVLQLRID